MRRKRNRSKQISNKTIIIVLFVMFILIGTVYALLSQELIIGGRATIPSPRPYSGWGKITVATNSYSSGDGITRYQFNYTITNTSNANIQGWEVKMNIPENAEIGNNSNGDYSIVNGQLYIYNLSNNALITPGQSVQLYLELDSFQTDYQVSYLSLNGIQMNLTGQTVPATAIYINQSNIKMYPDQTNDLTVRFEPYNGTGTVVWTSSDTSVASITSDTGILTSVAPGNCIITATCGNLSDTCSVTVESNVVDTDNLEILFTQVGNPWQAEGTFFNVQYSVHIKNLTDQPISNWEFDMVLPAGSGLTQQPWGCTITNTNGTTFHVVGPGYGLAAGATSTDTGMILKVPTISYIPVPTNVVP